MTSVNSLYSRKIIVSGVQCSSCNRGGIGSASRTCKMVIKIDNQHTIFSSQTFTNFRNLHKLYTTFGKRELVAILSNTPTISSARTPQVTRTKKILAAMVEQFDEKTAKNKDKSPRKTHIRKLNFLQFRSLAIPTF